MIRTVDEKHEVQLPRLRGLGGRMINIALSPVGMTPDPKLLSDHAQLHEQRCLIEC